jgi:hypothetical protein
MDFCDYMERRLDHLMISASFFCAYLRLYSDNRISGGHFMM